MVILSSLGPSSGRCTPNFVEKSLRSKGSRTDASARRQCAPAHLTPSKPGRDASPWGFSPPSRDHRNINQLGGRNRVPRPNNKCLLAVIGLFRGNRWVETRPCPANSPAGSIRFPASLLANKSPVKAQPPSHSKMRTAIILGKRATIRGIDPETGPDCLPLS